MTAFEEIVKACLEDERLLDIVRNVARMSEGEREVFRRKVLRYFADKTSEVDVQAYRFFKFVLEDGNASKILEEVERLGRDQG